MPVYVVLAAKKKLFVSQLAQLNVHLGYKSDGLAIIWSCMIGDCEFLTIMLSNRVGKYGLGL